MKKVEESIVMERLFRFLKEFPEFDNLKEIRYDSENGFVWVEIGFSEKVIPIKDDCTWMGVVREVITELEKEKLWNAYLGMTNGKSDRRTNQRQCIDVIYAGAIYGKGTTYIQ